MLDSRWSALGPESLASSLGKTATINEIEDCLGMTLPKELSNLLENKAGAIQFKELVEFHKRGKGEPFFLHLIYGSSKNECGIINNYKIIDDDDLNIYCAFGEGASGNKFCLNKNESGVYYWRHDIGNGHIEKIADSMSDFLNHLFVSSKEYSDQGVIESGTWFSF